MEKHWLTIVIILLILGIIIDGIRRMRRARQDSIKMALRPANREQDASPFNDNDYGSEFPNGGARASDRQIDPERIQRARNKYGFSNSAPSWGEKIAEKIAEHTGLSADAHTSRSQTETRIEPSLDFTQRQDDSPDTASEPTEAAATSGDNEKSSEYKEEIQRGHDAATPEEPVESTPVVDKQPIQAQQPVQTSLNLDDAVPMLMDTLSDDEIQGREAGIHKDEHSDREPATASAPSSSRIVPTNAAAAKKPQAPTPLKSPANKPSTQSKNTAGGHGRQKPKPAASSATEAPADVLVIHLRAPENEYFYGSDLLEQILANGMRYGSMNIFHRHAGEDGEGPVLFSMANMVKPGNFDLHTFEEFSTIGLSFFLTLPSAEGNDMKAFDVMLNVAQRMATKLAGELKDEQRSVLTRQTIEHYRERIRDFSRRQRLAKNK